MPSPSKDYVIYRRDNGSITARIKINTSNISLEK